LTQSAKVPLPMLSLSSWKHCQTDPLEGIANFDAISIVSDSLLDRREDRVMPIFQEEQVLMCRLMRHRLKFGQLVLDVGTGSGVLGIYAASKAGCRVVGIDISKRALRFAKANCQTNAVPVLRWPERPEAGQLSLCNSSLEQFINRNPDLSSQFDVILLNPPFNPTCPTVFPALHASAGPDGQGPFRNQLHLVPTLQKVGGYSVGYQMSYDRQPREVAAIASIRRAYRHKCQITFAHVLRDKKWIGAEQFLRAQYESFLLASGPRNDPTKVILEQYIRSVGGRNRQFSLIYYEVRRESSVIARAPKEVKLPRLPNKTWRDRIWLQRCIVDHSARTRIS
jgi:SAM-dependent methyltransferase